MKLNNYIQRPIRNCRKQWYIFFYTNNKNTQISLYNFNINNPLTINGKLQYASQVVINKGTFNILIHFPIRKSIEFQVKCEQITKKKIIHFIQKIYQYIYDIEEITATPNNYTYFEKCDNCLSINKYLTKIKINTDEKCVICLNKLNQDIIMLNCEHLFHYNCIIDWNIYGNGKRCPICRQNIFNCKLCNGKQKIKKNGSSVVIPIEHREDEYIRNDTNGVFEIYSYDLERLILKSIYVDKNDSKINIHICV